MDNKDNNNNLPFPTKSMEEIDKELEQEVSQLQNDISNVRDVFALLPTLTLDNVKMVEKALKNYFKRCNGEKTTPSIAEIASFSYSPNITIIEKLNELKLDKYLQYINDQEKAKLEEQGFENGSVANTLLQNKHNIKNEGINPLEAKFVPDLNVFDYQKNLMKDLEKKGFLKKPQEAKEYAKKLHYEYVVDSGKRFPTRKK